jgi:hypothetical protein
VPVDANRQLIQRYFGRQASMSLRILRPREIDQNPAHLPARDGEKVIAIPNLHRSGTNQTDVSLMDESRGLERVAGAFASHRPGRYAMQLIVNERHCLFGGGAISRLHAVE